MKNIQTKSTSLNLANFQLQNVTVEVETPPLTWNLYWLKKNEYNVHVHKSQKSGQFHNHSFFEVLLLTEGSVEYLIEDTCLTISAGDFIVFCPQTKHKSLQKSNIMRKIAICFDVFQKEGSGEISDQLTAFRKAPYHFGQYNEATASILNLILTNFNAQKSNTNLIKYHLLNAFLFSLLETIFPELSETTRADPLRLQIFSSDEILYQELTKYLRENLQQNISQKEIANTFSISLSQLNRRLFRYSGMSYQQIKDNIKISVARELLYTNMSMRQIGETLGFCDEYSFNRFFRRVEGITPGKFREAAQSVNYK